MPQPSVKQVHINKPLTNVAVAFYQSEENFIGQRVFPRVPVQHRSDVYWKWPRAAWLRSDAQKRAPGTESAGTGYDLDQDQYLCEVWALHTDISDMERANADELVNLDANGTRFVTRQLLLRHEKEWTSKYFGTSIWGTDVEGVATGPSTGEFLRWDAANSDPVDDILAQQEAMAIKTGGYMGNVMVMGYPVYRGLYNNAAVRDRLNFRSGDDSPKNVTRQALADLLDLEEVFVAKAVENTANEGADASNAFVQGKHALLAYRAAAPSIQEPSAGYTFVWTGLTGSLEGFQTKQFRMEERESDRVEVQAAWDHKVVAADLGTFFETAVS